ncbi:MAG: DUF5060 domain-containing protein [Sedimentisphaerales bacterium]|nr:DUF5060 domain-containing protein [Sedimentisphaerales bacterium]
MMNRRRLSMLRNSGLAVVMVMVFACSIQATVLNSINENTDTPGQYEKYEATFTLSRTYTNPFDTDEVEVNATITQPDMSTVDVPAFYCRLYQVSGSNPETYSNPGPEEWKFRFAPARIGSYAYTITVIDIDGTQTVYTGGDFTCSSGTGKGFVRINSGDNLTFIYDNGTPRINRGHNVAWANDGWYGATGYEHYYSEMSTYGENWIRIWMCPWSGDGGLILEWRNHTYFDGVGRLSQQVAQRLDTVVDQAEQYGIAIQLTLQYHGAFSTRVNPNWDDNPYNIVHSSDGGFLTNPEEFFTDSEAKRLTKNKYRYIIARWGYSPAIFAWELWNEVQYTGSDDRNWWTADYRDEVVAWHDEMATYIKSIDPHAHPVTTSDYYQLSTPLYELANIDIVQEHFYDSPTVDVMKNVIRPLMERFNKPVIVGEFGNITYDAFNDRLLMHNGNWAGFMLGQSAHQWWWDEIDPGDWYEDFGPLAIFTEDEDVSGMMVLGRAVTENESILAVPLMEGFADIPIYELDCYQEDDRFTGMAYLSIYLHAGWSSNKSNPIFHVDMPEEGHFILHVKQVSDNPNNVIEITIDSSPVYNQTQPQNGSDYEISVPIAAGPHTVQVLNEGQDWIEIRKYEFRPDTISYVDSLGLVDDERAYVWIYDDDSQEQRTHHGEITGETLTINGLEDGWYNLDFYLTRPPGGAALGSAAQSIGGVLTAPMPGFERDVALKVTKALDTSTQTLVTFVSQWLQTGEDLESDYDGSNKVDLADFAILSASWLDLQDYMITPIVVSAGENQTVLLPSDPITMDPEVNAIGDLTHAWTMVYTGSASPAPTINDICSEPSTRNPEFTFSEAGTYDLTLTVENALLLSDNATSHVEVVTYMTRFEAEDADLSQLVGGNSGVYSDILASNGYYALIDWVDEPRIIWHINASSAGTYHIYVQSQGACCYEAGRGDYLKVNNGSNQFHAFGSTEVWTLFGPYSINLNAGDNTIQIIRSWGGVRYDFIEIPDL